MRISSAVVALSVSLFAANAVSAATLSPPKSPTPTAGGHSHPGYPVYATFCAAGTLIFDSWYVGYTQHRELTSDEAIGITASCFFPPLALYYLIRHANEPAASTAPVRHRRHR
jgi:hypothetical protein